MTPLLLSVWLAAAPADRVPAAPAVETAIAEAVRARLGDDAEVVVSNVALAAPLAGPVTDAVPAPGAVLGASMAFVLRGRVARDGALALVPIGRVTADVRAAVPHWHAARAVARGARLAEADLQPVTHALPRGAAKRPPALEGLVEGRALADLAAGACLTARVVVPSPAVVAGREVAAVVRTGALEVRAALVAVDSGVVGAEVRVMHPESRRTFRARVIGRAEVEINHEP